MSLGYKTEDNSLDLEVSDNIKKLSIFVCEFKEKVTHTEILSRVLDKLYKKVDMPRPSLPTWKEASDFNMNKKQLISCNSKRGITARIEELRRFLLIVHRRYDSKVTKFQLNKLTQLDVLKNIGEIFSVNGSKTPLRNDFVLPPIMKQVASETPYDHKITRTMLPFAKTHPTTRHNRIVNDSSPQSLDRLLLSNKLRMKFNLLNAPAKMPIVPLTPLLLPIPVFPTDLKGTAPASGLESLQIIQHITAGIQNPPRELIQNEWISQVENSAFQKFSKSTSDKPSS